MGEEKVSWTLEQVKKAGETARRIGEELQELVQTAGPDRLDPRALALVVTKLEEAELWLGKVRRT